MSTLADAQRAYDNAREQRIAVILAAKHAGMTDQAIADELELAQSSVTRLIARHTRQENSK